MEFGPEDLLDFGIYYLPSLGFAVAASVALLVAIFFTKRLSPKRDRLVIINGLLVPVPLIWWVIYFFMSTSELAATLTLLDSESSGLAEKIYETRFKKDVNAVDEAVSLAVNKHQAPNVRFYASCLIADMLATNDDVAMTRVLKKVENAPIVETEFFGGNKLTEGFYIPGYAQVSLSVREIVEQRLQDLHKHVGVESPTNSKE